MSKSAAGMTLLEAHRITAVVEDGVDKLGVLSLLEYDGSHGGLLAMRSDETGRLLDQQSGLAQDFQQRIEARRALAGASKAQNDANEESLKQTSSSLRQATKTLTRNLQENVDLAGNLVKIHTKGQDILELLAKTASELQDSSGSFPTLQAAVDKEEAWQQHVAETMQREKDLSEKTTKQRERLNEERMSMNQEMAHKDDIIAGLKDELVDLKIEATTTMQYVAKDTVAKQACEKREQERDIRALEDKIRRCEEDTQVEQRAHQQQVRFISSKTDQNNLRAVEAESSVDADFAEKNKQIDLLKEARQKLLVRLSELEEAFDADEAERQKRAEEKQRLEEEEAERQAAAQRSLVAATLLQCNYRMHLARVAVDDVRNPKKKKKGKGGKKGAKGKGGTGKKKKK